MRRSSVCTYFTCILLDAVAILINNAWETFNVMSHFEEPHPSVSVLQPRWSSWSMYSLCFIVCDVRTLITLFSISSTDPSYSVALMHHRGIGAVATVASLAATLFEP